MPRVEPLLLLAASVVVVVVVWRYYLLLRWRWVVYGSGMANPFPACRVPVISIHTTT
jgi:hypothetical protein